MRRAKNRNRLTSNGNSEKMSGTTLGLVFLIFVSCAFLLMFTFAERLTRQRQYEYSESETEIIYPSTISNLDNSFPSENFTTQEYTWECENKQCRKTKLSKGQQISLNTCNMLCSDPPIWPKPKKLAIDSCEWSKLSIKGIHFIITNKDPNLKSMLEGAANRFLQNIEKLDKRFRSRSTFGSSALNVNIIVTANKFSKLTLKTNEHYTLQIQKETNITAFIESETYFGTRHALETLSQIIWFDEVNNELKILNKVFVEDSPSFPYRGLLVDVARNYFPISQLKKVIDGMAASKLNVFHLHLTDAVSFPIVLPRNPQLAFYGAYGPQMIYTARQIKDLASYALARGIRLILEIDGPSHMNAGWEFSKFDYNENYVMCESSTNGQLNPDNENALNVVEEIYSDLLELSEDEEIFHLGGDEVDLNCWRNTEAFRNSGFSDITKFWADYANKLINRLKAANNNKYPDNIVIWSSPLTNSPYLQDLNGNITVQFWFGDPQNFLRLGHSVIYSTVGHWYLDCGFGMWKPDMKSGVCDPYTPWQLFYKFRPWLEYGYRDQALGGEACLWAEEVDVDTLETRIWPRTAAFAERLWSDPDDFNNYDVYTRFVSFRERLIGRGMKVSGMWPRWCSQNPGLC